MTKEIAAYGGQGLYRGRGPCRPPNGRQAPVAPGVGDRPLFFARDLVANLKKKKITLRACRPMRGRLGDIFEIFKIGHIFLKFLFLKNIKKKKRLGPPGWPRAAGAVALGRPLLWAGTGHKFF